MFETASGTLPLLGYGRARGWERFGRWVVPCAWICPLVPIVALYAFWMGTAFLIGRPVEFGDTAPIGELAHHGHRLVGLIFLASMVLGPVCLLAGLVLMPAWVRQRGGSISVNHQRVLLALHYVVCFIFFMWDPFRAFYWFVD
jgi:hypothetical protein